MLPSLRQQGELTNGESVHCRRCGSCVASIESALRATPGIISAVVSLATERASITYDPTVLAGVRDIVELIEDTGFDATLAADENSAMQLKSLARTKEITEWRSAFIRAFSFGLPVFLLSMVMPMSPFLRPLVNFRLIRGIYLGDLACFFLTLPVQFGVGLPFYRSAWRAIKHKSATMDVLVVLGTSAAFTYSVASMLLAPFASDPAYHPKVFYDTCTMLLTFISLGRYLENIAKGQTSTALSRLMSLAPSQAIIYTDAPACTKEKKVATELIQVGDVVKIVPGDKVPADGIVIRGESAVDESMVTGEVVPVAKSVDSTVIGGTVNGRGTFDMRVTRAGKDTALAQIVNLVEDAQTSKAPIQAFADTVAGYFVPVVISLGLSTFITWMIISHSSNSLPHVFHEEGATKFMVCLRLCISVIVVACPCALGLSTPTAVMVGTGVGAQHGILIKGAGPLEASHKIDRIVLDKTGTITLGKLDVVGVKWVDHAESRRTSLEVDAATLGSPTGWQDDTILLFAVAETKSEHPLAKAVARWGLRSLGLNEVPSSCQVESFESVTGQGVRCDVTGHFPALSPNAGTGFSTHRIEIGSEVYLSSTCGVSLPASLEAFREREEALGRTCIVVAVDGSLACVVSLADQIKGEARQAIDALRAMGIEVLLATGDQERAARAIADEVGIAHADVQAGMSPNGKKALVEKLQKQGHRVAMVSLVSSFMTLSETPVSDLLISRSGRRRRQRLASACSRGCRYRHVYRNRYRHRSRRCGPHEGGPARRRRGARPLSPHLPPDPPQFPVGDDLQPGRRPLGDGHLPALGHSPASDDGRRGHGLLFSFGRRFLPDSALLAPPSPRPSRRRPRSRCRRRHPGRARRRRRPDGQSGLEPFCRSLAAREPFALRTGPPARLDAQSVGPLRVRSARRQYWRCRPDGRRRPRS